MTDPSFLSVYQRTLTLNCSSGTRTSSVWSSTSYLVFLSVVHTSGTRHHTRHRNYNEQLTTNRMAVTLWSIQTPGTAQLERDINVMNNKKKVVVISPCPWRVVSISMLWQVIKMLMVVVALFTLAWLPLQLYDVLNQMVPEINMSISSLPAQCRSVNRKL